MPHSITSYDYNLSHSGEGAQERAITRQGTAGPRARRRDPFGFSEPVGGGRMSACALCTLAVAICPSRAFQILDCTFMV